MPEFLFCLILVGVLATVKRQQIRFIYTHFTRTFTNRPRQHVPVDPYRNNPEVERDCARRRADAAEVTITKLQSEIAVIRLERDLAHQERDLRVFRGRARLGSAFALGALTCFTSVNVAPQIAHDLLTEQPATSARARPSRTSVRTHLREDLMTSLLTMTQHYYPYRECAAGTCCHRNRLRLVEIDHLMLRFDASPVPVQYFWLRINRVDDVLVTSGGENSPSEPEEPQPAWIERYALPAVRENPPWITPLTAFRLSFTD